MHQQDRPIPGKPKFRIKTIRFPEDEISPYVKWDQFFLFFSPMDDQEKIEQLYVEVNEWCQDQFGPPDGYRWQIKQLTFCFSVRTDSAAFRIRWC
jgi:hypothetical protein